MRMLNGFFDTVNSLEYPTENSDILPNLKKLVPGENFRGELEVVCGHERKSHAGRRPFDAVMMFKVRIQQSLYNLSDDEMEYQIMERLSFTRFPDLDLDRRDVSAGRAYRSAGHEADLRAKKFRPHLPGKGCNGDQLASWKKQGNHTRSRVRSKIGHVFGAIHQRAGEVFLRIISTLTLQDA